MRDAEQQAGRERVEGLDVMEVDAFGMAAVVLYGHDDGASQAEFAKEPRSYLERAGGFRRWPAFRFRLF